MELEVSVNKSIGDFQLDTKFTLSSKRGGVFGASGSGKTTLMHLLAGLIDPDEGRICLNGEVLYDSVEKIHRSPQLRRIGVVFQHALLFPHLTVKNNLLYGWKRILKEQRKVEPGAVVEALNLESILARGVNGLSGGERQRVALARTILACPKLILMDEPLSGLDYDMKKSVIQYMNTTFSEFDLPYLYISHSVWEMQKMTDEVLIFSQGRLVKRGDSHNLFNRDK